MTTAWKTLDCLGVRVGQPTWEEFRYWFFDAVRGERQLGSARSLFLTNAHTLNVASGDPAHRTALARGDAVLNDGAGLELYGRLAGAPFEYNFNGTDLFPRLFSETPFPLSIFLFGAIPGRAERAAKNIQTRFPGVRVLGARDGFAEAAIVDAINAHQPDLLLVGLGSPKQELWIDTNREQLEVGVVAGVGALFDFLSGAVPRAPEIVRRARLEWAYRLALEPRRMFRRYVIGNPQFLLRSGRYLAAHRKVRG